MKRTLISGLAAGVFECLFLAIMPVLPTPILGRVFVAVGLPLGELLIRITPGSWVYQLAPEGGANAAVIVFGFSSLLTWFVLLFATCFVALGRTMRPNSAPQGDGRQASHLGQPSSAPAPGRER